MFGFVQFVSRPFPVEQMQGPDFIPVVIAGIFLGILIYGLFKW